MMGENTMGWSMHPFRIAQPSCAGSFPPSLGLFERTNFTQGLEPTRLSKQPGSTHTPGSLNRNAFCCDVAGYLKLEVAGRIVEIQGEGAAVRIPVVAENKHFTEVDGSLEVSVRVVHPHVVSKLVRQRSYLLPRPEADVAGSGI